MDKIKVLMIDDNVNLIEMVKEYFKNNDKIDIVLEAHDGLEGIKVVEQNQSKFDLIILDLIMPHKDGIYVLNEMKKRGINKNVIVATSYNAAEVIREVSEFGVNYYILKPFDLTDLEKLEIENKRNKLTYACLMKHQERIKDYSLSMSGSCQPCLLLLLMLCLSFLLLNSISMYPQLAWLF